MNTDEIKEYLINIVYELERGNIDMLSDLYINMPAIAYECKNNRFDGDESIPGLLIMISDILYNNTSLERLPLDDSLYDSLFEYVTEIDKDRSIGAKPIEFNIDQSQLLSDGESVGLITPAIVIDEEEVLYANVLFNNYNAEPKMTNLINPVEIDGEQDDMYIERRVSDTSHMYPELVGTLMKSRAVLVSDVPDEELLNDPTYRILERDFFRKHIEMGILDPNREITIVAELKYDGISIEADTSSIIHSARTRGDTSQGVASDMTPLFGGYRFNKLLGQVPDDSRTGVKFEAIVTKENLAILNDVMGSKYVNCRSAVVGLTSLSDGYKYRDLISLVPLAISGEFGQLDRLTEVQAVNELYVNDIPLHYAVMHGNYKDILFEIRKFVQEAQEMRDVMPFMYDGVVITYVDDDIREALGRTGYINQYQEAVKFEALKKSSIFTGYTYTVGQDGRITPMIHYQPVEFFGTVHDKSTGHSYQRVKDLGLKIGDIIDIEYVGDVMPYVTKPDIQANRDNPNPVLEFIDNCLECGTSLSESETGKTKICTNPSCPGKLRMRTVNMLSKLNIKDFSSARLELLNISSFTELMNLSDEQIRLAFPTDGMANKLQDRIDELHTRQIPDYQIVGSLGFTNVAASSWKAIFEHYTLDELLESNVDIMTLLMDIPGIGEGRAHTVYTEWDVFKEDLEYISKMDNIVDTKNMTGSLKIRFSGVRDAEFVEYLISQMHDAGEGGVTKDTDILVVPHSGFSSGKVKKAIEYDIDIISIDKAKERL